MRGPDSFADEEFNGFPGGIPAFAICTLRACGVAREEPVVAKGLTKLRTMFYAQREKNECRTYTVGLMCLAAADEPPPPPATKGGTSDRISAKPPVRDVEWLQDMVRWLEAGQSAAGGWSYEGPGSGYDFSNTQFALLGLRAAARGGAEVNVKTWMKALDLYVKAQEEDGPEVPRLVPAATGSTTDARRVDQARGWGYHRTGVEPRAGSGAPYGSMTASGVAAVAICRDQLAREVGLRSELVAAERAIRDGIAWLGRHFTVTTNPGPGRGPAWSTLYHYLYGLERAGMLAPVDWMAEHDWYGEGAQVLIDAQDRSGAWLMSGGKPGNTNTTLATFCALLFLKRGTARPGSVVLTPSSDEAPIDVDAARNLPDREFDEFIAQMLVRVGRVGDGTARERVLAEVTKVGPRILGPLVLRLASSLAADRETAFALLRHATGLDHGYDPGASAGVLEAAVTRWQSWLLAHSKELRYDVEARRIVAK